MCERFRRKLLPAAVALAVVALAVTLFVIRNDAQANTIRRDNQITPVVASATGAASASNASIPAVASETAFLEGFDLTGCAPTTGNTIVVTVAGLAGGTQSYSVAVGGGVTLPAFGVNAGIYRVRYPQAIPASAAHTAITVNVGSFGSGSTAQACTAYGYYKH